MTDTYKVKTSAFEGPLDLLLDLIEKRKLHINDISLAEVTDDYIAHLNEHETFPVGQAANFVLVASTLLLIKSKALLPTLSLTLEEEESMEDLEYRLKLYKRFKQLSKHVEESFGKNILFTKISTREQEPIFSPDEKFSVQVGKDAINFVLQNLPKIETIPKTIVKKIMSLEEMIDTLTTRIQKDIRTNFRDFSGMGKSEKVHVILSFLAILELVKQGVASVTQDDLFSDITIELDDVSTPRYG